MLLLSSLAAFPVVGTATNKLVPWLETQFKGKLFTVVEIDSILHGDVFQAIMELMEDPDHIQNFPFLTLNTTQENALQAKYCLGFGDWRIQYKDKVTNEVKTIYWNRERNENLRSDGKVVPQKLTLSCLKNDWSFLADLIQTAIAEKTKKLRDGVRIFSVSELNIWQPISFKRPIRWDGVILRSEDKLRLEKTIKHFCASKDWYLKNGRQWTLGILLHGKPGTGKSTLAFGIASHYKMNIYQLNMASRNLDDEQLQILFSSIPGSSIILLEDVDAMWIDRENAVHNGVTMSGLLNVLNGVATSSAGIIVIMTTNHLEKLDPALIRPGRVDLRISFNEPTEEQIRMMIHKFFPFYSNDERILARVKKIHSTIDNLAELEDILVFTGQNASIEELNNSLSESLSVKEEQNIHKKVQSIAAVINKFERQTIAKCYKMVLLGDFSTITVGDVMEQLSKQLTDVVECKNIRKGLHVTTINEKCATNLLSLKTIMVKEVKLRIKKLVPKGLRFRVTNIPLQWSNNLLEEFLCTIGKVLFFEREKICFNVITGSVMVIFSEVNHLVNEANCIMVGNHTVRIEKHRKLKTDTATTKVQVAESDITNHTGCITTTEEEDEYCTEDEDEQLPPLGNKKISLDSILSWKY